MLRLTHSSYPEIRLSGLWSSSVFWTNCASPTCHRSGRIFTDCRQLCSALEPWTHCSTIRCSCTRSGLRPKTPRSWRSIRAACTISPCFRMRWRKLQMAARPNSYKSEMERNASLTSGNPLKLGLFGSNCSNGRSYTTVPERWDGSWENNLRLAQLADSVGLECIVPIARWKGYGGQTNVNGSSFESIAWACGLLAGTLHVNVFCTV